jgi:hypothetical protein
LIARIKKKAMNPNIIELLTTDEIGFILSGFENRKTIKPIIKAVKPPTYKRIVLFKRFIFWRIAT